MAGYGQLLEQFEKQFEPQGDGYLYRCKPTAPPIAVSKSERDRFVDDFRRQIRYGFWGMAVGMALVAITAVASLQAAPEFNPSDTALNIGTFAFIGIMIVLALSYNHWAWKQPLRELEGRRIAGEGRTREEVNRNHFSQLGYKSLAFTALIPLGVLGINMDFQADLFAGMNLAWLIMAAVFVAFMLYAIIQKLRYGGEK